MGTVMWGCSNLKTSNKFQALDQFLFLPDCFTHPSWVFLIKSQKCWADSYSVLSNKRFRKASWQHLTVFSSFLSSLHSLCQIQGCQIWSGCGWHHSFVSILLILDKQTGHMGLSLTKCTQEVNEKFLQISKLLSARLTQRLPDAERSCSKLT